jgi:hypothetical protein
VEQTQQTQLFAAAAIEAVDTDPTASVVLLEKMSEKMAGGASRCVAGCLNCPPEDAYEKLVTYQRALNEPSEVPEDVLPACAKAVTTQRPWIEQSAR